ncbi:MAG: hypothetical protein DBX39_02045 [Bacillota bacterium]|nr:MAG: hypothetical protein DBX39_02045 [Bacillota bacterium]
MFFSVVFLIHYHYTAKCKNIQEIKGGSAKLFCAAAYPKKNRFLTFPFFHSQKNLRIPFEFPLLPHFLPFFQNTVAATKKPENPCRRNDSCGGRDFLR